VRKVETRNVGGRIEVWCFASVFLAKGGIVKKFLSLSLVLTAAACLAASPLLAQEHPTKKEHPSQEKKKEHPGKEHPQEHPKSAQKVSTDDIDRAIRAHIEEKTKSSGGRFPVNDSVLNKTWELDLVRVHQDKLTPLADGTYFACVDFKAADGAEVDVDFFLKKEADRLAVTDTSVHKINGKARYSYKEKDGVWERVAEKG